MSTNTAVDIDQQKNQPVIKVRGLMKHFEGHRTIVEFLKGLPKPMVKAVDGIDLNIRRGEVVGLVGESGCGKTTLGRVILRLVEPTGGSVIYDGKDLMALSSDNMKPLRQNIQIVFQDPYDSMDPRNSILQIVSEPLYIQNIVKTDDEAAERVRAALESVNLTPAEDYMKRFPHELSGGQRQRIAIARALVLDPDFIVADEPVSMLDVSIRGEVLNLMLRLAKERNVAFLYITHDLATARHICDRIAVMYLGKIVELATADDLVKNPLHPYTKALIGAVLSPDPRKKSLKISMQGEVANAQAVPQGCRLHPRCPIATEKCKQSVPELIDVSKNGTEHLVACHMV